MKAKDQGKKCKGHTDLIDIEKSRFLEKCEERNAECWKERQYSVLTCMDPAYFNHEDFNIEFNKSLVAQHLPDIKKGVYTFCW